MNRYLHLNAGPVPTENVGTLPIKLGTGPKNAPIKLGTGPKNVGKNVGTGPAKLLAVILALMPVVLAAGEEEEAFAIARAEFAKYHLAVTGRPAPADAVAFAIDPSVSKSGNDAYTIISGTGPADSGTGPVDLQGSSKERYY